MEIWKFRKTSVPLSLKVYLSAQDTIMEFTTYCYRSFLIQKNEFRKDNIISLIVIKLYIPLCHWGRRHSVVRVPVFQSSGLGSLPGGVRNFNFHPGTVCVSSVLCPIFSPAVALTLCWPHIEGSPPLSICPVFWSRVCSSSYRHLTHGHLRFKS